MIKGISSIRTNIIANFAGKAWTGIINIAFVPFYIKFLGIEAYGLIGLFVSLLALLTILDMGLSATLNRELARLVVIPENEQKCRNLTRTFEIIYWGIGLLIGLIVVIFAPLITKKWVQAQGIPPDTIEHALVIMGFIVAIQWPCSLYSGGLAGLQQQVLMNGLRSAVGTAQAVGAILVLWLISPTLYAYFIWQLVISVVQTVVFAYSLWRSLPKSANRAVFDGTLLITNFRFAAGMAGISVVVTILTQTDKIILSKMLPLKMFGYYILAVNVGSLVNYLVQPVATAVFPKFAQLSIMQSSEELARLYHKSCQFTSIILLPAAVTLFFFANDLLMLWLRDATTVQNVTILVKIIVIGSAFNAIMTLPYNLQLAHGWTNLSLYKNILAVLLLVPLLLLLVRIWNAQGAAMVWVLLNTGYFFIEIPIMHRVILKSEMRRWYVSDIGIPFLVTVAVVACSRFMAIQNTSPYWAGLWIAVTAIIAFTVTVAATPIGRAWLLKVKMR